MQLKEHTGLHREVIGEDLNPGFPYSIYLNHPNLVESQVLRGSKSSVMKDRKKKKKIMRQYRVIVFC